MISPTPTLPTLHSKVSTVIWRLSLVSKNQLHFSCGVSGHTILLLRLELCSEVMLGPPAGFSSDTGFSKEPPRAPFRSFQIVFRVLTMHAHSPLHFCYHRTKWTVKFTFKYLLSPKDCKLHWTSVSVSCSVVPDSLQPHGLQPSVHEVFQARILEWVAISFSRGSFQPRNQTRVSCTAGRFLTNWATREALHWTKSAFIHHYNPRAWHNAKHLVGTQDYYLWKDLSL